MLLAKSPWAPCASHTLHTPRYGPDICTPLFIELGSMTHIRQDTYGKLIPSANVGRVQ